MSRAIVPGAFLALTLLLAAPFASADYLQASVDAGRTGVTSELGPQRDDVAFIVEVPGTLAGQMSAGSVPPVIIDGAVYAAISVADPQWEGQAPPEVLDTNGIVRVDLTTAQHEVIVELDTPPLALVSDGDFLYVLDQQGLDAYPLDGGPPVWSWMYPRLTYTDHDTVGCSWPAVGEGTVYLLCNMVALESPTPGTTHPSLPWTLLPGFTGEIVAFVTAVDIVTGDTQWVWAEEAAELPTGDGVNHLWASPWNLPHQNLGGISIIGDGVMTLTQEPGRGYGEAHVRAFAVDDGALQWNHTISPAEQAQEGVQNVDGGFLEGVRLARLLSPGAGTQDEAYYVVEDLRAVDPITGADQWSHPLPQVDPDLVGGNAFALSGNDLFVASKGVLFKFDRAGQRLVWEQVIGAGEHFDAEPMVLAGNFLYARTHQLSEFVGFVSMEDIRNDPNLNPEFFYAYNPQDGSLHWKHKVVQDPDRYYFNGASQFLSAVAAGVMAIQGQDGTIRVLGTTPASLAPTATANTLYPEPREEIHVDLSATRPGVHGAATGYRAAWGDGTVTEWQDGPLVTHAYSSEGDRTAEFFVRNEAGQTAHTTITFHVGEDPPVEPNWIAVLFEPDNQDMTFGVLGILVALLVAMAGVTHQRRKRGRLQKEIDAADAVYRESRDDPMVSLRALKERKALAQGLAVDGKLDEAQFGLLRDHIDGLSRRLRVPLVEEEFGFLPASMLRSLRTMMEDGRMTRYERDAFLGSLSRQRGLSKPQKQRVKKRIEAWFEEDSG